MQIFAILTFAFLCAVAGISGTVKAKSLAGKEMPIVGCFAGKDGECVAGRDGTSAKDLSGIACVDQSEGRKQCLVINDENTAGQLATLEGGTIIAGALVPLIDLPPAEGVRGAPPKSHGCTGGTKRFKDLDGEGVAVSGTAFLVAGSHGCSRKEAEFRASSFLLVRISLDEKGQTRTLEWSYRLSDFLRAAPGAGEFFAVPLDEENQGLNIEGIASLGDELLVGLRAPTIGESAVVVAVPIEALFAEKPDPDAQPKVVKLALGRETGIRDLASLPDGRLIVLAGPTREQAHVPFSIHLADPARDFATRPLAVLDDVFSGTKRAKAEAITLLEAGPGRLRLLVLFDGLPNGGPREYDVSLETAKPDSER